MKIFSILAIGFTTISLANAADICSLTFRTQADSFTQVAEAICSNETDSFVLSYNTSGENFKVNNGKHIVLGTKKMIDAGYSVLSDSMWIKTRFF